jgi:probable F420-dependent oxidoreductase
MKHWTTYPLLSHPLNPELVTGEGLARFARAAEVAGFRGIGFTDHPAPSHKWLTAGGHDALDPFAALSYVAAVTEQLRLIPNIVVLPYRNPFLVAKTAATLDALSGGRFVLSVAIGYLRSEHRNDLFDQALEVLRGVWTTDEFAFEGRGYTAGGVSANPKPAHIPIWIGGNSARTRRRVARHGDGWNPFPASAQMAQTARTQVLETADDLAPMIAHLHEHVEAEGRDPASIDIAFTTGLPGAGNSHFDATAELERQARLAELGVTWCSTGVPGDSLDRAIEALQRYGEEVIARQ